MYMHSRQSCFSESPAAKEREKEHVDAHMLLLHPLIFLLPHMFTVLIVFPSPFSSFAHLFFHTHIYTFSHRVSFVTRVIIISHTYRSLAHDRCPPRSRHSSNHTHRRHTTTPRIHETRPARAVPRLSRPSGRPPHRCTTSHHSHGHPLARSYLSVGGVLSSSLDR